METGFNWTLRQRPPPVHTLNLWLLSRIWPSPAIVALVQIASLALVSGIWFYLLRKYGTPRGVTLALAIPLAILPPGCMLVITLWKDVAYSIAVVALSAILFEIFDHSGRLATPTRRLATARRCRRPGCVVPLQRHPRRAGLPGRPAYFLSLYLATGIIRRAVSGLCGMGNQWPANPPLGVDTTGSRQVSSGLVIHPIAAHLYFGTPLTQQEEQMLSQIRPLNDFWSYHCYSINPTTFSPSFNHTIAVQNQRFLLDLPPPGT